MFDRLSMAVYSSSIVFDLYFSGELSSIMVLALTGSYSCHPIFLCYLDWLDFDANGSLVWCLSHILALHVCVEQSEMSLSYIKASDMINHSKWHSECSDIYYLMVWFSCCLSMNYIADIKDHSQVRREVNHYDVLQGNTCVSKSHRLGCYFKPCALEQQER